MSLPAYLILVVINFLLIKDGHVHFVSTGSNINYTFPYEHYKVVGVNYFLTALAVMYLWIFWGQVFSVRSIAASYFTGKSKKSFSMNLSFAQIRKALLASIAIYIIGATIATIFELLDLIFIHLSVFLPLVFLLLFAILSIGWLCRVYLVVAFIGLENPRSIFEAFSLSRLLVKGYKGRIFMVQFWIGLIQGVILYAIAILFRNSLTSLSYLVIAEIIYFLSAHIYACSAFVFYRELRLQGSRLSPEDLAKLIGISSTDSSSHNTVLVNSQVQSDDSSTPVYGGRYPSNEDPYRGSYGGGGLVDDSDTGDLPDFWSQIAIQNKSQSMPEGNL